MVSTDIGMIPSSDTGIKAQEQYDVKEEEYIGPSSHSNLVFDEEDVEPELHLRTWIALAAMLLLVFTAVLGPQGTSAVLTYIGTDLHNTKTQTWIVNSFSLVQAVIGPILSSASDIFQARKLLLVGSCVIAFIGTTIAPGSSGISRLIGANVLVGVGFAAIPLAYAVPAEILPRRWRPLAQAALNAAALLATAAGPLTIGALTERNAHTGWRNYYWLEAGLWGLTLICIIVGYRPPKRHTEVEDLSLTRKILALDLVGCGLLTIGLTLFLIGMTFGGGQYTWTDARTLAPLIIGFLGLIAFGIYEWKGTSTGIVHHDLFQGGKAKVWTLLICIALAAFEGILIFAFALFYPIMSQILFTTNPILVTLRSQAVWIPALLSTMPWGWVSARLRTIRMPLAIGFLIVTVGTAGIASVQPGESTRALAFAVVVGIGLGAPLALAFTGAQLVVPHNVLATVSAVVSTARAIGVTVFVAIFSAIFNSQISSELPKHIGEAATASGLPASSIPAFIAALSAGSTAALANVPGITPKIIAAGGEALQQAYADSIRVIFIISAPIALVGCIISFFLTDLKKAMNFRVEAPVEELHAKHKHDTQIRGNT